MILIAVIVGYILGIAPFIFPKILDAKKEMPENVSSEDIKTQNEIFDEWLNGPKLNQEDLYKEYMTGEETRKGE